MSQVSYISASKPLDYKNPSIISYRAESVENELENVEDLRAKIILQFVSQAKINRDPVRNQRKDKINDIIKSPISVNASGHFGSVVSSQES